jgi:hypothetical protein
VKAKRAQPVQASIPINRWLALKENPDAIYQIPEVYPHAGADRGRWRYGAEFFYTMPADSAVILSLEPAPTDQASLPVAVGKPDSGAMVVKAF